MINETNTLLARRYAQAFFNINQRDMHDEHLPFIKKTATFLHSHSTWLTFFDFPNVNFDQQKQMIKSLLKHFGLPEVLEPLGELLCVHKRMVLLPDVLEHLIGLFLAYNGLVEFTIESFPKLADEQLQILIDIAKKI